MNINFIFLKLILLIILLNLYSNSDINISSTNSFYYEEKYFRILSNNYDTIDPGENWEKLEEDGGIGFKAKKDYGSLILLKDWSMYNFKLTKVLFRNNCLFDYENIKCAAEMWLIHTKDNGYYPPGRRIFIKQNYFILVIPFVQTQNENPAIDSLFHYLNLDGYHKNLIENQGASTIPKKPVKLYQIIQNQPSILLEGIYKNIETLFMVFTQYHFISESDYNKLNEIIFSQLNQSNIINLSVKYDSEKKLFRNMKSLKECEPRVSLMIYSKGTYLKNILLLFFFIIFLF